MPNIEINKKQFDNLVEQEISNEKILKEGSYLGAHWHRIEGDTCDVETYPDRPDLLSVEGLARAYRGFFGVETGLVNYDIEEGDLELEVDSSVEEVRPFIGASVVRGLELSQEVIEGLIQLQEKMHETMGRRRDKLAIGLHDLSTVEGPFEYKAVDPDQISFVPLEKNEEMQLGEILEEHEKGQEYSWILEDEDQFPIIIDSEDRVLSFPPIINNQLTEVDSETVDVLVEVTGKHRETVMKALNILTTALAERGGKIESIEVDGDEMPDLSTERMQFDPEYFNSVSGADLETEEIIENLEKMRFSAEESGGKIEVEVPAYRTDVMHQYDLIEDVMIAHGYDNVEPELPEIDQMGEMKPIEDFTEIVRDIISGAGALEANTYYLSNKEKLFARMEKEEEELVEMSNPLTKDYAVLRNRLLPSLMEVLKRNKHHGYPQEFFEAEDVALLDDSHTGASNRRKLAYVVSGNKVDYTDAKETLQVLERDLGIELEVREAEKPFAKESRSAGIFFESEKIGFIAELSEQVVENWELERPVSGFELDLEKLKELK